MKKVLFATTATAALAIGGMASAQGISLFGDARLGLGYNINNEGDPLTGDDEDDVRAVSRVRFGVNMTGETNSGITFGATIRADNAIGGQGGAIGQSEGSVFVSGSFGTLTLGDTNGADEQWVGDLMGNYSLTGLGDINETVYISNGGNFGNDDTNDFFANPEARPTIRYDFEIAGFGLSLSSNRDLSDVGVGGGYSGEFGGGTFEIGLGYYDYSEFDVQQPTTITGEVIIDGVPTTVTVPGLEEQFTVPGGEMYSGVIGGTFGDFGANVIYTSADSDSSSFQTLGIGGTFGFGDYDIGAFYNNIIEADGGLSTFDSADAYGLTAQYDLGGGASVNGGVVNTYGNDDVDSATVADFGIKMSF